MFSAEAFFGVGDVHQVEGVEMVVQRPLLRRRSESLLPVRYTDTDESVIGSSYACLSALCHMFSLQSE